MLGESLRVRDRDPYHRPAFSAGNRARRFLWGIAYLIFVRFTPRPMHAWRAGVLRLFGAKLARGVHIYPTAKIWAPWNLVCGDSATIGEDAIVYNPKLVRLGSHAIVSQYAYLCGATHDYQDPAFPLIAYEITLGAYSWICARATVQPGVTVGDGSVLALGSVATRDLEPWVVYGGIPARPLKERKRHAISSDMTLNAR